MFRLTKNPGFAERVVGKFGYICSNINPKNSIIRDFIIQEQIDAMSAYNISPKSNGWSRGQATPSRSYIYVKRKKLHHLISIDSKTTIGTKELAFLFFSAFSNSTRLLEQDHENILFKRKTALGAKWKLYIQNKFKKELPDIPITIILLPGSGPFLISKSTNAAYPVCRMDSSPFEQSDLLSKLYNPRSLVTKIMDSKAYACLRYAQSLLSDIMRYDVDILSQLIAFDLLRSTFNTVSSFDELIATHTLTTEQKNKAEINLLWRA